MQTQVLLPQVELTMESALIAKWLVKVGDRVEAQQPLLEVETQKATTEIPAPSAGYVRKLCVDAGQHVSEKALLCILTDTADEVFDDASPAAITEPQTPAKPIESAAPAPAGEPGGAVKASPVARRVARELGVDLSSVRGTGPGGRITEEDVRAAVGGVAAPTGEGWTALPATRVALIAQMQKSLAEIPQIHIQRRLDVTKLAVKTAGITFTHRLVRAAAAALKAHPPLRTIINGNQIKVEPVSVAVAMDTPHGLVAPVIRNADQLSLDQIAQAVVAFRSKAESNTLTRADLTNGPFAITNLGMLEVDQFDAFVFHGQTAVLSVGRAIDEANGKKVAWFGLAVDHRVVDGAEAARFLQTLQTEIAGQ